MMTSSIAAGSIPVRSTIAFSTSAARSAGCHAASAPFFLPPATRSASTIYASAISCTFKHRLALFLEAGRAFTEVLGLRHQRLDVCLEIQGAVEILARGRVKLPFHHAESNRRRGCKILCHI